MRTSPKLGLRIWNLLLDPYDHEQLADNWAKVDAHDHSEGRGVLIPTEGIALQAINFGLIASSVFPEVSATGGELELLAPEEKPLAGGPELKVLATGEYEVGLQLHAQGTSGTLRVTGAIKINGASQSPLFEANPSVGDVVFTTNFARYELHEGDELTVGVANEEAGHCLFSMARISIWRVA